MLAPTIAIGDGLSWSQHRTIAMWEFALAWGKVYTPPFITPKKDDEIGLDSFDLWGSWHIIQTTGNPEAIAIIAKEQGGELSKVKVCR